MATLHCGSASNPVRVRNLSPVGALVEGASLPQVGSPIILRRGTFETAGTAVWIGFGKAGLSFNQQVDVSEWLRVKEAKRQIPVGEIAVGLNTLGSEPDAAAAPAVPVVNDAMSMEAVVAELVALQAQLGQLGDQLALDAAVVANHPEVRVLDTAAQRIGRIVDAM